MISITTHLQSSAAPPAEELTTVCGVGPTRCGTCRRTARMRLHVQRSRRTLRQPRGEERWFVVCDRCGNATPVVADVARSLRDHGRSSRRDDLV